MEKGKKEYHSPELQVYGSLEELTKVGNFGMVGGAGSWGTWGHHFDKNGRDHS